MKLAICLFSNVGISQDSSEKSKDDVINESRSANTDPEIFFKKINEIFVNKFYTDIFIHSWSKNFENILKKFPKI